VPKRISESCELVKLCDIDCSGPVFKAHYRILWLLDAEKSLRMFSRLERIPSGEGRTDGVTDILPRHSSRYAYVSRGKN